MLIDLGTIFGSGTLTVEGAVFRNLPLAAIMLELTTAAHHKLSLRDVMIYDCAENFTKLWPNGSSPLPAAASVILPPQRRS